MLWIYEPVYHTIKWQFESNILFIQEKNPGGTKEYIKFTYKFM